MAALELEGKIAQKMAAQSGQSARGSWARQDFVVEYMDGNFPSSVCFSAWGEDKVNDLARYQVGDKVRVSFNIKGREYNGRWYNDLRVWKLSPAGEAPRQQVQDVPSYGAAQAASYGPAAVAPAPGFDDIPPADGTEDDLPF